MNAVASILPLLLCVSAAAQSVDRVPATKSLQFTATAYGLELHGHGAMTLKLEATATTADIALLTLRGGEPTGRFELLASFAPAHVELGAIGVKGWLLVDTPVIFTAGLLDDTGQFQAKLDVADPELDAKRICLQALALVKGDHGYELRLSHGLELRFAKPAPK